jgi:hypothetical protein
MKRSVAVLALLLASSVRAEDSFQYGVARRINAGRSCNVTSGTTTECHYEFNGIKLTLVLTPRTPEENAFSVISGPTSPRTWLKFGGLHRCAIIAHHGDKLGEWAYVFISPRDGDVYIDWDVPACKL